MMVSFVLSFFPRDVLDEILNLIESVSEDFPSYSSTLSDTFEQEQGVPQGSIQGFSYFSKSGSRGRLIWEKRLAKIQNWEKRTGESK